MVSVPTTYDPINSHYHSPSLIVIASTCLLKKMRKYCNKVCYKANIFVIIYHGMIVCFLIAWILSLLDSNFCCTVRVFTFFQFLKINVKIIIPLYILSFIRIIFLIKKQESFWKKCFTSLQLHSTCIISCTFPYKTKNYLTSFISDLY